MTFDDVMKLTRTVGSEAAFTDEECRAYFDVLMSLEPESLIVEVGLEYGRSSSVALQVAKERGLRYIGIDEGYHRSEWSEAFDQFSRHVYWGRSENLMWFRQIDAILIDGDHSKAGVRDDCEHFLPYVKHGGYAIFHDWPEVGPAVINYMQLQGGWMPVKTVGSLDTWRKL